MAKRSSKPTIHSSKVNRLATNRSTRVRDVAVSKSTSGELKRGDRHSVPATQAKNRFGEILQAVRDSGPVFIERHGQAQAVVLGIETYNKLASNERTTQERELDYWMREFNALHARMQTDGSRQAVEALFSASDAELNRKRP